MSERPDAAETLAAKRYWIMNGVRIASLAAVIIGIAIARAVISAPYAVGVALAVAGLLAFYFVPTMLARNWKSQGGGDTK